jgi:hypothetical protein
MSDIGIVLCSGDQTETTSIALELLFSLIVGIFVMMACVSIIWCISAICLPLCKKIDERQLEETDSYELKNVIIASRC